MDEETDEPGEGGGNRNLRKNVGWAIAALAGIGGIITTVIALWPDPPFTIQDWAREANSVCDDTSGELVAVAQEANDEMGRLRGHMQQGTAQPGYFIYAGNLYSKQAGVQDKRAGEFSKIEEPNEQKETVDGVIADLRRADDSLYSIAKTLRSARSDNMVAVLASYDYQANLYNLDAKSVNDRLADIGADACVPNVEEP
ncbi:hypothetical protein ACWHLZ_32850 [Streptomyces chartreusis]